MDFVQAQIDIITWITTFVERPHPALHGWPPCPFARQARLQAQLEIRPGVIDPYTDLMHVDMGERMIVIYVYEPDDIDAVRFGQQIDGVNRGFLLARDLIALADHPATPEDVLGVSMNQGRWALAMVQPLSKLNQFSRQIAAKGYYNGWPEDYLHDLFQHREDPRQ